MHVIEHDTIIATDRANGARDETTQSRLLDEQHVPPIAIGDAAPTNNVTVHEPIDDELSDVDFEFSRDLTNAANNTAPRVSSQMPERQSGESLQHDAKQEKKILLRPDSLTHILQKKTQRSSLQFTSVELDLATHVKNCSTRCLVAVGSHLWLAETNGIVSVRDQLRFGKIDGRPILWHNGEWKLNIHDVQQEYELNMQNAAQQLRDAQAAAAIDQNAPVVRQSVAYINKCCCDPIERTVWMCATDGSIQIFNSVKKHDQNFRLLRVRIDGWQSHDGLITDIKLIPSKKVMVTCGLDSQIKFWNSENFDLIHVSYLGDWYFHALEVDSRGFVWASSENGHIYVYRIKRSGSSFEVILLNDLNVIAVKKKTHVSDMGLTPVEEYARKHTRRNATGLCALCHDPQQDNMWVSGKNGYIYIIKSKAMQGGHLNFQQVNKMVRREPYPIRLQDQGVIHQMAYVPRKISPLICMVCTDTIVFFSAESKKHIKSIRLKEGGFITSMMLIPRVVSQVSTDTLQEYTIAQEAATVLKQQQSKEGHLIHLIARLWICQATEVRELYIQEAQSPSRDDIEPHKDFNQSTFYAEDKAEKDTNILQHKTITRIQSAIHTDNKQQLRFTDDKRTPHPQGSIDHDPGRDIREAFTQEFGYLNTVILRKADQKRNVKVDTTELYTIHDSWTQTKSTKRKRAIPVEMCTQTDNTGALPEEFAGNAIPEEPCEVPFRDKVAYDENPQESGRDKADFEPTVVRTKFSIEHQRLEEEFSALKEQKADLESKVEEMETKIRKLESTAKGNGDCVVM
eukprot:CAMPEP_0117442784 /NCGR_PEP_ID=MMETSP0759-20121206/4339_1 /TAXON_ID=63605 /ORGANISM="Percolomonas cosmopolitus, Strain WS" /LENGTH=795 /DNA_ID=CAMNT_0005234701 /DNA_START=81 /DNA_END=2468 /DNA_ORIENTATION=-